LVLATSITSLPPVRSPLKNDRECGSDRGKNGPARLPQILALEEELRLAELGPDAAFFPRVLSDDAVLDESASPILD